MSSPSAAYAVNVRVARPEDAAWFVEHVRALVAEPDVAVPSRERRVRDEVNGGELESVVDRRIMGGLKHRATGAVGPPSDVADAEGRECSVLPPSGCRLEIAGSHIP